MDTVTPCFDNINDKLICNKKNIILKFNKLTNTYKLDLEIINKKYDIDLLSSFKIYDLIKKTNSDIIDDIKIVSQKSDNEVEVIFLFKRFGESAGILQKYLHINTVKTKTKNLIIFTSKDSNDNLSNSEIEKIQCNFAYLTILPMNNVIKLNYRFSIKITDELPIYMEHIVGLLMKKIFYNLKMSLENGTT